MDALAVFSDRRLRARVDVRLTGVQVLTEQAVGPQVAALILEPARADCAEQAAGRTPVVDQVEPEVEVEPGGRRVARGPVKRAGLLPEQLGREEQVVLLLEPVHAPSDDEAETLLLGIVEAEGGIRRRGEAPDALAVVHQRDGLQRVVEVRRVGVGRIGPALRVQVDVAGRAGEDDPVRGVRVVVVGDAPLRVGVDQIGVEVHRDLVAEVLAQVQPHGLLLVARIVDDARVVLHRARDEVTEILGAAAHADNRLGPEIVPSRELLVVIVDRAGSVIGSLIGHAGGTPLPGGLVRGTELIDHRVQRSEVAGADLVRKHGDAEPLRHIHAGRPHLPALGVDDHHPVAGLRAVDGRRGGALEDFDALDVLGVEVGHAVDHRVLHDRVVSAQVGLGHVEDPGGHRYVADDHPVHHEERFRAGVDRGDTAEPYLHSAARRAVIALDIGAGHFPLQRRIHRLRWGFGEIFGLDGGDRDPEIAALGPRDAAGHDDLFRQLPGQAHADIRLILWNRNGRAAIPRRAQLDRQRPRGRVGNGERAVRGSGGGERGPLDGDRYPWQRVAGRDVSHFSLDAARLCFCRSRRNPRNEQRQNRRSKETTRFHAPPQGQDDDTADSVDANLESS